MGMWETTFAICVHLRTGRLSTNDVKENRKKGSQGEGGRERRRGRGRGKERGKKGAEERKKERKER